MLLISGGTGNSNVRKYMARYDVVGALWTPSRPLASDVYEEHPWAADNEAFSNWNEVAFRRMLRDITGKPGCLFVCAPDVVGNHALTLERFYRWLPELRATGQPVAFVAQDGCSLDTIPWDEIDALFIGGSTEFKLSPLVVALCAEAKRRGKWLHMGRVNTKKRITFAYKCGCDSFDGSCYSLFPDKYTADHANHVLSLIGQQVLFMRLTA